MNNDNLSFNYRLKKGDEQTVRNITERTGFFTSDEVNIAEELAVEHLTKGEHESGYHFIFAHINSATVAYTCYGPIPGSDFGYDLYWIVTDIKSRGKGYGKKLLKETERVIWEVGGRIIYAETSSTAQYEPTRAFYEHNGYLKEAVLRDFYRPGDSKVIYSKKLPT